MYNLNSILYYAGEISFLGVLLFKILNVYLLMSPLHLFVNI